MKLVIVESPSKAKTISKYLGNDYSVIASAGHIRDLPVSTLGVSVNNNFEPLYITVPGKEKLINEIKEKIKKSDDVYLATDPDREGEAISWHIQKQFNLPEDVNRIEFNEITKNSVKKAIENPRKIDLNLVDAQQARRVLDRLVGYIVSPVISNKIRRGLSAGRVQSVALRMLVDKEREIRKFIPEEYWNIYAFISKENLETKYKVLFNDINGKKVKVKNKEECETILAGIKSGKIYVDNVLRKVQISKPNPPFTTSTMQQDAVNKLGFSAAKVSSISQKLYEGIDIKGQGTTALVTYIRTDSTRVSKEAQIAARDFIEKTFGKEYIPNKAPSYESKKNIQDAHEAIRPVSVDITPESIKNKVENDIYKLYKLIYDRFMASQMTNAEYNTLTVHIVSDSDRKYGFQLKGKTLKFNGYTAIYQTVKEESNEEKEDELNNLPDFNEGDRITLHDTKAEQKFTNPPLRYTEASLIKKLEESGIGRPSTYSSIMLTLSKRDYTVKEKKFIIPTSLGETVVDFLVKHFTDILDIKFTSKMEDDLDNIAEGKVKWKELLKEFYPKLEKNLANARNGERLKIEDVVTDIKCKKCSKNMLVKNGKYGSFLGCSGYPDCNFIMQYGDIVGKCPLCNTVVVKKFSKAKRPYYICADNKNCKFISYDIPAPFLCPKCNSTVKLLKNNTQIKYICTNNECKFIKIEEISKNEENN